MTGHGAEKERPDVNEATVVGPSEVSRRQFLGRMAVAGAGAAGLALIASEAEATVVPPEYILGTYTLNQNYSLTTMSIESQSGPMIIGRFDDGTSLEGSVAGARPGPVTLCFTRRAPDGTIQIFTGAVATRAQGTNKEALLTGVYTANGAGPLPWVATGTLRR